jgi:hypothetical protein
MSKSQDPETILNFLTEQRDEAPADLQHIFLSLEELWERKLWHQLTVELLDYFQNPESTAQRLPIYNTFIISFADKINQLQLVKLALSASAQIKGKACVPLEFQHNLTKLQMMMSEVNFSRPSPAESSSLILKTPMSMQSPNLPVCT